MRALIHEIIHDDARNVLRGISSECIDVTLPIRRSTLRSRMGRTTTNKRRPNISGGVGRGY